MQTKYDDNLARKKAALIPLSHVTSSAYQLSDSVAHSKSNGVAGNSYTKNIAASNGYINASNDNTYSNVMTGNENFNNGINGGANYYEPIGHTFNPLQTAPFHHLPFQLLRGNRNARYEALFTNSDHNKNPSRFLHNNKNASIDSRILKL